MKQLLLVLFFVLAFAQLAKQEGNPVIVCCRNYGDGMGDYSSGLYMAMKFKQLGCKVYLVAEVPTFLKTTSIRDEIRTFFKVFEPSFDTLYGLSRSEIYFCYFYQFNTPWRLGWSNRLFLFEELQERLPTPQENPALVFCPSCMSTEKLSRHYSASPQVEFREFRDHTFPQTPEPYPAGIYIYENLSEISSKVDVSIKGSFPNVVDKYIGEGHKFYFSYFGGRTMPFLTAPRTHNSFEFFMLVGFLNANSKDKRPILVALQTFSKRESRAMFSNPEEFTSVKCGQSLIAPLSKFYRFVEHAYKEMFSNPEELTSLESGKLVAKNSAGEPPIVSLSEFYESLNEKYKAIFDGLNIQSENISIIFYDSLPNPDFVWAIEKSQDFVGCTGDDSFSKVISMGKVPFYYAMKHKVDFKRNFIEFMKGLGFGQLKEIFDKFVDDYSSDSPRILNERYSRLIMNR